MSGVWELMFRGPGGCQSIHIWNGYPAKADILALGMPRISNQGADRLADQEIMSFGRYFLRQITATPVGDPNQKKWAEFQEYVDAITYKPGWYMRTGVELGGPDGSRMWVQIGVTEEAEISWDPIAGKKVPWRGGKHYLSKHMCRQEIVGTIHHAFQRAEMHEMNEWFRYKGRSIYNPHLDPDALVEVAARAKNFNTRVNAMTMEDPS